MRDRLQAILYQFNKMEMKKENILYICRDLPPELYSTQPDAHTWSVGQVANHLYLAEKNSLAYLKKKILYPDTIPSYHPKSWMGIIMTRLVFLTRYKVKAPPTLDMWKIGEVLSPDELDMKWSELREELLSFVVKLDADYGRRLAFRHPFAGRMTMYQMLIFMNDHLRHHQKQIKRIIRKLP